MENEQTNGFTIGELCRMIVKRIWYVLGAAVLVALLTVLIVYFAVNPAERLYSMQFALVFPNGSEPAYPDGEPFFYQDMVTKEHLDRVKGGEGLADIDVDRMIRANDIGIFAGEKEDGGAADYSGKYTVSVKTSYFTGKEQAEAFIRGIAQAVVDVMHAEAGAVDYTVSKETFDKAPFEERLTLLAQERETMLEKYDEWIAIYDAAYKLDIGGTVQSLKDYRASVTACFGESVQKELEEELLSGGYHYTDDFKAYTDKLEEEYARNAAEIEELKTVNAAQPAAVSLAVYSEDGVQIGSADPNVSQRLVELIKRNNMIAHWLGKDGKTATLTEAKNTAFGERLEAERVKLGQAAAQLTAVTGAIYNRGMAARFEMQRVETEGGVSVIFAGVAAAVVAFLAACVVVCAVETARKKKAHALPAGTGEPAGGASPEKPSPEETSPEKND